MTAKFETVTPPAMMPFDQLDADTLLAQVGLIGRRCATNLAEDSRFLSGFCKELERGDLWKKIAPTWDEFCQKAFSHPAYYIDMIRDGVALLDKGDGKPIPAEDARKAATEARKAAVAAMAERVPALEKNGTNRFSDRVKPLKPSASGPTAEYLAARIKRDRPDIADRMVKGEFKSVNEAARAAGLSVRPTITLSSPDAAVKSIYRLRGEGYVKDMVAAIVNNAPPEFVAELRRLLDE